jgi:hypothetical protein
MPATHAEFRAETAPATPMRAVETSRRLSPVRLRRHGLRPLMFEGALLAEVDAAFREGDEPLIEVAVFETADFGLAASVSVRRPGSESVLHDAALVDDEDALASYLRAFDLWRAVPCEVAPTAENAAEIAGELDDLRTTWAALQATLDQILKTLEQPAPSTRAGRSPMP